ncbi:MAG: hypothetical protein U5J62_03475, partial [Desulfurivibrio sp.]|nr:hypothetical protein [Desulfurivibrio sp.]
QGRGQRAAGHLERPGHSASGCRKAWRRRRRFGREQLAEMHRIIDAEQSDLFTSWPTWPTPPRRKPARCGQPGPGIYVHAHFSAKQQAFLDFVLDKLRKPRGGRTGSGKLTPCSALRYQDSIADAIADRAPGRDRRHLHRLPTRAIPGGRSMKSQN